jgi:hypothetical protein
VRLRSLLSLPGLGVAVVLAGCGASSASGDILEGGLGSPGSSDPAVVTGASTAQSGTLTAGDWDDNLNFELFQSFVTNHLAESQGDGAFVSEDRVIVRVVGEGDAPVAGAHVTISDASHSYLDAPTGSDGRLLFFPKHDGAANAADLTVTIEPPDGQAGVQPITVAAPAGGEWQITLPGAKQQAPTALDLAFVLDATGSMGDEIDYLKVEMQAIDNDVHAAFGNVSVHYGLIVYRDIGDSFVTKVFDFTSGLPAFNAELGMQFADGGGDEPEAMDAAVQLVPQLSWRGSEAAKMAFLVADAPPHPENVSAYMSGLDGLRGLGVKLYPIAASGASEEAEYVLRVGAQATLGRYLFLTDDSGVGDAHAEPHIPCYQVSKLGKVVARMIASELTGTRVAAPQADVIRSVGDPVDGVCTLTDGSKAFF